MLRVVFFGTPPIAADLLRDLLDSHSCHLVGIVTRLDKPKGRSKTPLPSPVKELAQLEGIPLLQVPRCHQPEALQWLRDRKADLFLVVAFGEILRAEVLDIPALGCWNLHASLLPAYRGAAPMQWALRNGEKETGVTLQRMVLACDAGDVVAEARVPIPEEMNLAQLQDALVRAAKPLLRSFLVDVARGSPTLQPQDERRVTWAPKIELEDCQIDWTQPATQIHNLIRSCSPEPGAFTWSVTHGERRRFRILQSRVHAEESPAPLEAGQTLNDRGRLLVQTGAGWIELMLVQPEGKRPMTARDLLNGLKGLSPQFISTENDGAS